MTKEEAIANLNMISVAFVEPVTEEQRKLIDDTFEMAIKALEQEPVLDKMRAEVINLTDGETPERIWNVDVLQIIDKYKAESEGI